MLCHQRDMLGGNQLSSILAAQDTAGSHSAAVKQTHDAALQQN